MTLEEAIEKRNAAFEAASRAYTEALWLAVAQFEADMAIIEAEHLVATGPAVES